MNMGTDAVSCRDFWMMDHGPGLAPGDAAELIESLGFDPRALPSLAVVEEARDGPLAASRFQLKGSPAQISAIRAAFERLADVSAEVRVKRSS
jgi:hypothetical protein